MKNLWKRRLQAGAIVLSILLQCAALASAPEDSAPTLAAWPNPATPTDLITAAARFPESFSGTGPIQWYLDGTAVGAPQQIVGGEVTFTLAELSHGPHALAIAYSVDGSNDTTVSSLTTPLIVDLPPVLPRFGIGVTANRACLIPLLGLMQGIHDPDGDAVQLVKVEPLSANGASVTRIGESILYHPLAGAQGSDSVTYEVTDDLGAHAVGVIDVRIHTLVTAPKISINNGHIDVQFAQAPEKTFVVETTSDLHQWSSLISCSGQDAVYRLDDVQQAAAQSRFYRVRFDN